MREGHINKPEVLDILKEVRYIFGMFYSHENSLYWIDVYRIILISAGGFFLKVLRGDNNICLIDMFLYFNLTEFS